MRIEYWGVDDELKKNPHFLHDREAQYKYIKKRKRDFSHYDMVMMYRFDSAMDTEECDGCGYDLDYDWKYCPHCGMKKRDEVHLFEDSVDKVKRAFKRDVGRVMDACDGSAIKVTCKREGKELKFELTPHYEAEKGTYKAGIWIKDTVAGIGTVTYYNPEDGSFGGLGHGICDMDTGALVPITRGAVLDVSVTEIMRGECGKPGEIRGFLKHDKKGVLLKNHNCGVFGVLSPVPKLAEPIPLGKREELHTGKAILRCALGESTTTDYEICIGEIDRNATSSKCFSVTITDPALLKKTGGIIQGMSGSPIIQNGKLVGAVTHVLINDPTTGYGIFIENMLNAANIPMAKAS